jgi:hypothetical protein
MIIFDETVVSGTVLLLTPLLKSTELLPKLVQLLALRTSHRELPLRGKSIRKKWSRFLQTSASARSSCCQRADFLLGIHESVADASAERAVWPEVAGRKRH